MADNGDKPRQKDLMYWLKAAAIGVPIILTILEFFGITNIRDIFIDQVSPYNTVIVLDGSAEMTTGVLPDGTPKFQAARRALEKTRLGSGKVALRLFGGSCEGEKNTWLELKFDKDTDMAKIVDAFQKRFATQKDRAAQGVEDQPALTNAIIHAITGELADESLKGTRKKLIAIAAGACPGNAAREIAQALRDYDPNNEIGREIQLIGMGIGENQRDIFRQIAAITGKNALFVDDQIDLEIALYNPEIADTFLIAKENWLFKQGQDEKAVELLTVVIEEGRGLSEIPSWAYEAMRLKAEILMTEADPHDEPQAIQLFGESAKGGNSDARARYSRAKTSI
ncbi:MAG: vWA domain-containing protein [bacterium]